MLDLGQLLPHAKKDFKLDTKSDRGVINEARSRRFELRYRLRLSIGHVGCLSVEGFQPRSRTQTVSAYGGELQVCGLYAPRDR